MESLEKQCMETKKIHLGKKNSISHLRESNNSKDVELLMKDIQTAALKRISSRSAKSKDKYLENSQKKNVSNDQEPQEENQSKTPDQFCLLRQNGNKSCQNSVSHLDHKERPLGNGIKNGILCLKDQNKNSSICDNISANIIQTSKIQENFPLQNGQINSHLQETMSDTEDEKDMDNSVRKENSQNRSDDNILNLKKSSNHNENLVDIEIPERDIEDSNKSISNGRIVKNREISSLISQKNNSQKELKDQTSEKEISQVNEKATVENKRPQDFADELILSGNVTTNNMPATVEMMPGKELTDSENDDKNNSPNFTSSVSEEEDPMEEGICIIINGKRLPPSSESDLEILRNSKERIPTENKDGTDPNQSRDSVFKCIEQTVDVPDEAGSATHTSDQESTLENSTDLSKSDIKTDILSALLDMQNQTNLEKNKTLEGLDTLTRNKTSIRPIIHNFLGDTHEKPSRIQSLNIKAVTFSQDTVFNEDKTKRYRKERVSIRNVYRNRISGSEHIGKINPLFEDDSDEEESYASKFNKNSLLERKGSFVYIGSNKNSQNENNGNDSTIDKSVLNFPSYMQKFLQNENNLTTAVAKINHEDNSDSELSEIQSSFEDQVYENMSSSVKSSEKSDMAEVPNIKITIPDKDEGHVILGSELSGYDVLIKKTIAKQQHYFFMKCLLAFLFVCGLLAIISIIVYFLIIKK